MNRTMTKKEKILKLFNELEWHDGTKYIQKHDLRKYELDRTLEFGGGWNDIYYLGKILRAEGYRVLYGTHAIYVQLKSKT